MKNAKPVNIVLGRGVFKVDEISVGLTRDGGNFSVEYEYREINADGDRGAVKGRIVNEGARAKLAINHLEVLTQLEKFHPGLKVENLDDGTTKITGTGKIDNEKDYHIVEFDGETKDGRKVNVKLKNAINLENISWDLKEKDDIVDAVTFQATYDEQAEDQYDENWEVVYG